jgi:uncharacterized protein YecT (DUF1311 family)
MIKISFILFVFTLLYINVKSQNIDGLTNPIDAQLESCMSMDSNFTTYGTLQCLETAINAWNSEIDTYYYLLLDTIGPDLRAVLIEAHNNWITYKNSEILFLNTMYDYMQGSMWKIAAKSREMEIVRQRALSLSTYFSDYTFE